MKALVITVYVLGVVFFWLLVFRLVVAAFRINPYNPSVQLLLRLTEPLVKPFRRLSTRPSRIDPAVFPPLLIMLLIVLFLGFNFFWGR